MDKRILFSIVVFSLLFLAACAKQSEEKALSSSESGLPAPSKSAAPAAPTQPVKEAATTSSASAKWCNKDLFTVAEMMGYGFDNAKVVGIETKKILDTELRLCHVTNVQHKDFDIKVDQWYSKDGSQVILTNPSSEGLIYNVAWTNTKGEYCLMTRKDLNLDTLNLNSVGSLTCGARIIVTPCFDNPAKICKLEDY